jgi:hypothetical protein
MRDADRIEAINREQLATATDRLLLRAARQRFARGSQAQIADVAVAQPARFADGSQYVIPESHAARFADGSQPRIVIASRAEGSRPRIVVSGEVAHAVQGHAAPRADGSQPRVVIAASLAHPAPPRRASHAQYLPRPERARPARRARSSQRVALMLMLPTLFGAALGIAALL